MFCSKKFFVLLAVAIASAVSADTACAARKKSADAPLYKDASAPVEARVEDLLSRMTLEEKVMQTSLDVLGRNANENNLGEVTERLPAEIGTLIFCEWNPALRDAMMHRAMEESRLGIPVLCGFDVIHGFRTIYPISIAQACSWNTPLVREATAMAAREARSAGVDWTFSPMIDVCRDPRWGRVAEGYGEDPYVNSEFCRASVKGYQGDSLAPGSVAACLKHYVGYGASVGGRDYVTSDVSDQTLWDTYLPPYKAGIDAGAATVMSSFNDINGVPGTANRRTLTDILKERWQFPGFVVADWDAVGQLVTQGFAEDLPDAAAKAINAGLDVDMSSHAFDRNLAELVKNGTVPLSRLDDAVRRILRVKFKLGLFDSPYTSDPSPKFLAEESLDIARRLAVESMVLLKNDTVGTAPLLPLNPKVIRKIAVIGPVADRGDVLLGWWHAHGIASEVTTLLQGIRGEFPDAQVEFVEGGKTDGTDRTGFDAAVNTAKQADVAIVCLGEEENWSGENHSRATISLPAIQEQLASAVKEAGKPVILVITAGRPLDMSRLAPTADAIIYAWQPGVRGGEALASLLSGRENPSGRLAITFPRCAAQIPIHYAERPKSRTTMGQYQDIPEAPLYPFGYGLSYTTFAYGEPTASATEFSRNQDITITIPVTNTGKNDGAETVFWYVNDPVSSITRPHKELRHFEKREIKAGATETFTFTINPLRDLASVDSNGDPLLEPGAFSILVGGKKIDLRLLP